MHQQNNYMCKQSYKVIKRVIDIGVSATLLLLTWPLLVVAMVTIRLNMGRPVLFKHMRPGLQGRTFNVYKLRTMRDERDANNKFLPDELRLTKLGKFLRNSSLDELPQLWNVLIGEMSLVGPRPLLVEYLPLYTHEQARRHEVRPGITGWAQVNGRNAISWEEKFALDVWYVEHRSFWLDLRILWMTVASVFSHHGISAPGQATMSKFTGSRGGDTHA